MTKPPNFYFTMLPLSAGRCGLVTLGSPFPLSPLSFALTATPGETRLPPNWFHPSIPSDPSQPVELIEPWQRNKTPPYLKNKKTKNPPLTAHFGSRTLTAHHPTISNSRTQAYTRYTHYTCEHMQTSFHQSVHVKTLIVPSSSVALASANPIHRLPSRSTYALHSIPSRPVNSFRTGCVLKGE